MPIYRWAMRFYAADLRSLYAGPDMNEIIERPLEYNSLLSQWLSRTQ
ncbi:MAG: hypothetical protein ACOY0R_21380 [Chloroflexota bacterium]